LEADSQGDGQVFATTKMARGRADGDGKKVVLTLSDGRELTGDRDEALVFM
jgi:hypothetical protein